MKKTKITTLTTAALAATILATTNVNNHTVKADSTDDQTATKAQTPKEVAQTNVDNAKKDVENAQAGVDQAQNDLNAAQSEADDADSKYNAQSEAVSSAQADVNKKSKAASAAQSKASSAASLASEAKDPKKVEAANEAVNDAEDKVTQANTKKSEADQAVAKKNEDITAKSEAVTTAQNAVASASVAKSNADKAVSEVQKALDGTGINEAQKALDDATNKVNDDTAALDKATKEQQTQQAAYDKAKQAKDEAEQKLKDAQKAQAEAQTEFDKCNKKYEEYENKVAEKKKQLKSLEEESKNNIVISDVEKYKKAYIDYINGGLTEEDISFLATDAEKNSYQESKDDDKEVDINNLSESDIKNLNLYTADLISKVRNQFGWSDIEVTQGSIKFTQNILNGYAEDYKNGNWKGSWHDSAMINRIAAEYDLPTNNDGINQPYEDMAENRSSSSSTEPISSEPITLNNIKRTIYDGLISLILPTHEGMVSPTKLEMELGHARGVLGIDSGQFKDEGKQLFGVAVGNLGTTPVKETTSKQTYPEQINGKWTTISKVVTTYEQTKASQVHFINILKSKVDVDNKKLDLTPLVSLKDQKDKLTKEITDIEKSNPINQSDLSRYEKIRDSKTKIVETLSSNLNNTLIPEFKTKENEWTTANKNVDNLNKALQQDQEKQAKVKTEYNNLAEKWKELTNELKDTKSKQREAQNNLNTANITKQAADRALTVAQSELAILKQNAETAAGNVRAAQQTRDNANNHVSKLQNANSNKEKAESNLNSAKQALNEAKENLNKEQAKLSALEQAKQAADKNFAFAKANLDSANTKLSEAENKLKNSQEILNAYLKNESTIDEVPENSSNESYQSFSEDKKNTDGNSTLANEEKKEQPTVLNPAAVVVDKEGNTVTTPKTLPAGSQTTSVTPETKTINGKDYVQVGNDEFVPANAVSNIDAKNKTVELKEETEVVDKDGKTIKQPVLVKEVLESSDIDFTDAPVVTINGKKYYQVADNQYVPTSAIKKTTKKEKSTKPTKVKLTHNAFVYDKNGKVVKSKTTIKFIRRGKTIKPVNVKTVTIKGKKYYQIGKNQYIKAANAKIKTHPVKVKAVLKTNFKAVDLNGKRNGKTVKSDKKYHFNEKRTINGKTYYKIIWTNNWIPASELSIKK